LAVVLLTLLLQGLLHNF
jgi:hypothetical protein